MSATKLTNKNILSRRVFVEHKSHTYAMIQKS